MVLLMSTRLVHIVIRDGFRPIVVNGRSRSVCDDMITRSRQVFNAVVSSDRYFAVDHVHPSSSSSRIV